MSEPRSPIEPIALGDADRAVLDRLRALALLFRAAAAAIPLLGRVEIGLWVDAEGVTYPYGSLDSEVCQFLAKTAGWTELAAAAQGLPPSVDAIYERASRAEMPSCPPALARLLTQLRNGTASGDAVHSFAHLGWVFDRAEWLSRPLLPAQVSAHEALEALLGVEAAAHSKHRPLDLVAREAARVLLGGSP